MFLRQIARRYCAPEEINNLGRYCFVFPNRRSSLFFRRYVLEEFDRLGRPAFIPSFTNISDLVARYSVGVEASRNELIFALYDSYRKVLAARGRTDQLRDFDRFRFWGDLIINDFNDVDRYLVDAGALFTNIKRLKEISADYLTPEQREIVSRFWGDVDEATSGYPSDVDRFWMHAADDGNDGSIRCKFLSLWEILHDIYIEFRSSLRKRGLTYTGMAYRDAAEALMHTEAEDLPFKRYIFVGFNVLSTSELKIFKRLQELGSADFYWDFSSPAFFKKRYKDLKTYADITSDKINHHNQATRFVGQNLLRFPSLYPLDIDFSDGASEPTIEVLAVPGNTAQAKEVARIIQEGVDSGSIADPSDAIDTCVVVNDDSVFVPLLHSIPESIGDINITLGMPKRHTEVASLMSAIIGMHGRARRVSGEQSYFYEDVLTVLNHPIVLAFAADECFAIRTELIQSHLFTVPASLLRDNYPTMSFIFADVDSSDSTGVCVYLNRILDTLTEKMESLLNEGRPVEGHERQLAVIEDYRNSVSEIDELCRRYGVRMEDGTYFALVESMINSDTINFSGRPLRGLQIMNMLETRTLDFKNLVMLSMNERIFPRKHYAGTFIPNALRSGYCMSTIDHQESIFSYYFYRLLTRAEKVSLIYDSCTSGISSGEMSRYIYQLKYLGCYRNVVFRSVEYQPSSPDLPQLSVKKDAGELAGLLEGGTLCLSASALKTFAGCPLKFYLQYVRRWNADDEDAVKEFMTPITYGNVVHHVAQKLFEYVRGNADTVTITDDLLERMKTMKRPGDPLTTMIEALIREEVNKEFHNLPTEKRDRPLKGQSRLLADIMTRTVCSMLEAEKSLTPFEFYRAEFGGTPFVWRLAPDLAVRFKMSIDRVDITDGGKRLRFIDYKTGSDGLLSGDMATLASRAGDHAYGAVFQLMTYAMAYTDISGDPRPVQPYIYKLSTVMSDGFKPVRKSEAGDIIYSHLDYLGEFRPGFVELVRRIFDTDEDFSQCERGSQICNICRFAEMCGRVTPN